MGKKKTTKQQETPKTIHEKLNERAYTNQLPFVRRSVDEAGWRKYQAESKRLHDLFKADALEEVGLTGHPKAEKAFDFASDDGHGSGLQDVLYHLSRFAELLLDDND